MWYRIDKNITAVILLIFGLSVAACLVAKLWVEPAASGTGSLPFWIYQNGKIFTLLLGLLNLFFIFVALIALYFYPSPKPDYIKFRPVLPVVSLVLFFITTSTYTGQGALAYDFSTPQHTYRVESLIDYNGALGDYAQYNHLQVKLWECDAGGDWCTIKQKYNWNNLPPPTQGRLLFEFDKYQSLVRISVGTQPFSQFNLP